MALLKAKEKERDLPLLLVLLVLGVDSLELRFEGWAIFGELLDRKTLGLVVS